MEQTQVESEKGRQRKIETEEESRKGLVWFLWFLNLVINNWAISRTGPKTDI